MLRAQLKGICLATVMCLCSGVTSAAEVVKETVIFLQEDGRHYFSYTTARTDWPSYDLYLQKERSLEDFLYIYPNDYRYDTSSDPGANILRFAQSDYALIQPGSWSDEVRQDQNGVYRFRSASNEKRDDGHFGYWTKPGNFAQFVYVWVVPANFEILSYQANRKGDWVQRHNTLAFYGKGVNDLIFDIAYRPRSHATFTAVQESLQGQDSEVQLEQQQSGVRVTLAETLLFPVGSSELSERGRQVLARIARGLKRRPGVSVIVSGHTDDSPIKSALRKRYLTNWELSSARSLAVVHEMMKSGFGGGRLQSQAFGPYRPRAENSTSQGRAMNRRIELEIVESR
ncbi:MAG: OmpA family protein [Gammaproteobacteria bacterium]|nr:OmpA family protein [Gammaproteobacteria bacterium]